MKNSTIRALLVLSAWLSLQSLTGQIPVPANYQIKHSYQCINEIYYLLSDTLSLSPAERVEANHSFEIYRTERYLGLDGEKTTMMSLLGFNQNESWLTIPYFFLINQDGIKAYDVNQNLIQDTPNSEFYLEKKAYIGSGFFPEFPVLSEERREELQQGGFLITGSSNQPSLRFGNRVLIYDQPAKKVIIKELDDQQKPLSTTEIGFITLSGGENVMSYLREIQSVTLSGGTCATKVSVKTFSKHLVEYGGRKTPKSESALTSLKLSPNPVEDELNLEISGLSEEPGIIRIFNASGRQVFTQNTSIGSSNRIQVSNLKPGTYLLHLQSSKINDTIKFIKR